MCPRSLIDGTSSLLRSSCVSPRACISSFCDISDLYNDVAVDIMSADHDGRRRRRICSQLMNRPCQLLSLAEATLRNCVISWADCASRLMSLVESAQQRPLATPTSAFCKLLYYKINQINIACFETICYFDILYSYATILPNQTLRHTNIA